MNKILLVILFSLVLCVSVTNNAVASDFQKENSIVKTVEISGSFQFDSSLSAKFMEKHGYSFIEESYYGSFLTTNMYGAQDVEVIIEDEHGTLLGTGVSDKKGKFSISVPPEDSYRIVARFHDRETDKMVEFKDIDGVIVYVGFFKSETVDIWMTQASQNDCYSCDVRYAKK